MHTTPAQRRHYWAVAVGLQQVDGLEVSPYLHELAAGYEAGTATLEQTDALIREYHGAHGNGNANGSGDNVLYADPTAVEGSLRMVFSAEAARSYGLRLTGKGLEGFCHTIAFLWQVHPFVEGNTRTVAVFSELYLNHLGFSVTNEPFELHSRYYRDALVRARYRNVDAGVLPEPGFLARFYDNAVNGAGHALEREELVCEELFEHPELLRNIPPEEALAKRR